MRVFTIENEEEVELQSFIDSEDKITIQIDLQDGFTEKIQYQFEDEDDIDGLIEDLKKLKKQAYNNQF